MTYQLNPLVNAQKSYGVIETRLFYLGLQDINPHITENDVYFDEKFPNTFISCSKLKKIFGNSWYLPEIKKACRKLIKSSIEIEYEDGIDLYTVFQHIRYKENEGLYIKFNEDMRNFILDIYKGYKKYGFTKIEMQQIFILDSAYAMRLMELLLQYKGKNKAGIITRKIGINELRKRLDVPETAYKTMCNFRKRVLDSPIEEIERKTKYKISYKTIKDGRTVTEIEFTCDCSNVIKYTTTIDAPEPIEKRLERDGQTHLFDSPPADEPTAPAIPGLTEGQQDLTDRLINRGVSAETAKMLVKKYSPEVISSNLKYAVQQKDTAKNLAGLIIKFVENDIAGNQEKAKKEAKKREEKRQKEKRMAYGIIEEKENGKQEELTIDLENISDDFKKFLKVKKGGK